MAKEKIEFIEPDLVEKDYREFTSGGFTDEDEAQIAWCEQWQTDHLKKKANRRLHRAYLKYYIRMVWKHFIGAVKGTGDWLG